MLTRTTCSEEIVGLHEFFVRWFRGTVDREALSRVLDAMAPEFEMVTPAGERLDRTALVDGLRESHGRHADEPFDIEIRAVETVALLDAHAVVRYEEWQTTTDGESGRVSTALLRSEADAPAGVVWVTLQETALSA